MLKLLHDLLYGPEQPVVSVETAEGRPYEEMTVEELEAENRRLMEEKAELRRKQRHLAALRDAKAAIAVAEDMTAHLNPLEKKALRQLLQPEGIVSQEEVSRP